MSWMDLSGNNLTGPNPLEIGYLTRPTTILQRHSLNQAWSLVPGGHFKLAAKDHMAF